MSVASAFYSQMNQCGQVARRKRFALALAALLMLLAAVWWLASFGEALAHANLASSEPAANSELEEAPNRVIIWFTEPIEPAVSSIRVLDATGAQVDEGNSVVDDLNPLAMSVGLSDIPDGTYTVAWSNVSTIDGHRVRGSFVFAVGQPLSGAPVEVVEQPLVPSPFAPPLRWLVLLGAMAMVGGLALELLVTRPVLLGSRAHDLTRAAGDRLSARALRVIWGALALFAAASVGQLLVQTTTAYEVPIWQIFGGYLWDTATGTEWGRLWLWRMAAVVAFAVVLAGQRFTPEQWRPGAQLLALILGCAALWTLSLTSHGAATVEIRNLALAADFLHLLASAFWVGGVFHLALGVPLLRGLPEDERRESLAELVPRFSVVAALSVAVIVATGVFSGWAQITVVEALSTPYGATLIAKIGLVLALLFLGGLNLAWVRPRLRRDGTSGDWLRRLLIGEAVLGVLILASVGMLTTLEPGRAAASRELAEGRQSLTFSDTVNTDNIALEVSPARVGPNDLTVTVTDRLGRPIDNASEVVVRLVYLESDLGADALTATPRGDGEYLREDARMSVSGVWQVELEVRRPDAFDARTAFRFEVLPGGGAAGAAIAPSLDTAYLMLGAILLTLGVLFLAAGLPLGGWFSRAGAGVMTPGVAGVAVGLLLLFNAQLGLGGGEILRNPYPPTPESLGAGETTYAQSCQSCHGVEGRGDGAAAAGLLPPPADLTIHVPLHPDADLFRFIRDGIPNTAMVAQGGILTEDQMWHVVNYIRTLEE